ncbi:MAG: TMEM43 family protein [Candidatus Riflebacteria bacterium]|nr:TMEM43 family protein [Candidatus Riflebacteria bacterium]
MTNDSVTVVTENSWFSRIKNAVFGVLFGLLLFFGSFVLLFWNEGRAVQTYRSLNEGLGKVVSIAADKVDPANEGKLVHTSALADTTETITDEDFGISEKALVLKRLVQIYQWVEKENTRTEKQTGGSERTITTYSYSKEWVNEEVDSKQFHESEGHVNPADMFVSPVTISAKVVTLGAFNLPDRLVQMIDKEEAVRVATMPPEVTPEAWGPVTLTNGIFYLGKNPSKSEIGDCKVSFAAVKPQKVSVVSKQVGTTFSPFQTEAGDEIDLLSSGELTAQAMFSAAQSQNTILTWVLRAVGFFCMAIGLILIFGPISVFLDVLPFLGNLAETGISFVSFSLAAFLSLGTIAFAWIFSRPIVGIALFAVAFAILYGFASRRKMSSAPSPLPE